MVAVIAAAAIELATWQVETKAERTRAEGEASSAGRRRRSARPSVSMAAGWSILDSPRLMKPV
jgi:hypothetical protein